MIGQNKSKTKSLNYLSFLLILLIFFAGNIYAQSDVSARNPVIWADVPDPSIIRVDSVYYMSSTTMHMVPGLPIMRSTDLVNWEMSSYAHQELIDNELFRLENGQEDYGRGSWASSIRYHNGTYYVVTFSYSTGNTHIFRTDDIESGNWTENTLSTAYHDPSLVFEDDRVFLTYGRDNIQIIELETDLMSVKSGGVNQVLIPDADGIAGTDFIVPAEGAHLQKINGKYYVSLITWPSGSMRTQLIYRSDSLLGTYEGRIALQHNGVAQGGMIDTPEGDWYAFLFRDYGAVGRIPYLVPVQWEDDWPVFGVNGQVPNTLDVSVENDAIPDIVGSDEFDYETDSLSLIWQWNHNPDHENWSVTERPGFLRLRNGESGKTFLQTRNTLTQRTFGPESSGIISLDISNMRVGDVAGIGALQENYGYVGIKRESGGVKALVMADGDSEGETERERILIDQDSVYLQVYFNFRNRIDRAYFFYSLDGYTWESIGNSVQMSYTIPHFMGYRMALFNYATDLVRGYVDIDYFRISNERVVSTSNEAESTTATIPNRLKLYENYPNPFNPSTLIRYDLHQTSEISIDVFSVDGRHIQTLEKGIKTPGEYTVSFDAGNLSSGVYIYRIQAGNQIESRRMTLIK